MEDDPKDLLMFHRRKPKWQQLISGLYMPPLLKFGAGYPCPICCGECPCPECDGASPPCCFKVVISGIVEGSCGECDCLNSTYYAKYSGECLWTRRTLEYPCDSDPVRVTVYESGGSYYLKVELGGNVWIKNYGGTKPTCESLTDESIPYSASGTDCDASSSTCLVTAIAEGDETACPQNIVGCPYCECDLAASSYQVVISGIQNTPTCTTCDVNFNGTFIVTQESLCLWRFTYPEQLCFSTSMILAFGFLKTIVVRSDPGGFGHSFHFRKSLADYPDCRNLSNENVPVFSGHECDMTLATCLVTALL